MKGTVHHDCLICMKFNVAFVHFIRVKSAANIGTLAYVPPREPFRETKISHYHIKEAQGKCFKGQVSAFPHRFDSLCIYKGFART